MFRIAIVVAILFAARANTLENDEKEEIALKRILEFSGSSIEKLEESDRFEPNIEELPISSGGEKEDIDSSSAVTKEDDDEEEDDEEDFTSSSAVSKEDDDEEEEDDEEDSTSSSAVTKEDDDEKDTTSSSAVTKEDDDLDDSAYEHTFKRSLEESLSVLNDMINKANPGLKESTKRSFKDEDMIEGDIKLDKETAAELVEFYKRNPQYLSLDNNVKDTSSTDAMSKRKVRQSNKWTTMPIKYRIKSSTDRAVVKQSISIWQQETCLSFVETAFSSPPGITFTGEHSGCWSYVGKMSFGNTINLGNGCKTVGIALHEIGHAIGFYHEQSRPDRNGYVTIKTDNILDGKAHNFLIKPSTTYGTKYDYGSIMHYRDTAFAKASGLKTIIAKQPNYERTMGQRTALSFYDIKAANYHYCQGKCTGGLTWSRCKNGGYRNPKICGRCKCPDGWTGRYCTYPSFSRPPSRSCGSRYRTAKRRYRSLKSPGYSSSGYTSTTECTWKIRAPAGKRVKIYFRGTFRLTCNSRCEDFVEVRYKSLTGTGPRFCCLNNPRRSLTSTGREMLILFRTFSGQSEKGFHVRYRYV